MATHHRLEVEAKYLALGDKILSEPPKHAVSVGYLSIDPTSDKRTTVVIAYQDPYTPPELYKTTTALEDEKVLVERLLHDEVSVR